MWHVGDIPIHHILLVDAFPVVVAQMSSGTKRPVLILAPVVAPRRSILRREGIRRAIGAARENPDAPAGRLVFKEPSLIAGLKPGIVLLGGVCGGSAILHD